jgi:hypothetical protein
VARGLAKKFFAVLQHTVWGVRVVFLPMGLSHGPNAVVALSPPQVLIELRRQQKKHCRKPIGKKNKKKEA